MSNNRPEEETDPLDSILEQAVPRDEFSPPRQSLHMRVIGSHWTSALTLVILAEIARNYEGVIKFATELRVSVEANWTYILAIIFFVLLAVIYILWTAWIVYRLIKWAVLWYQQKKRFEQLAIAVAELSQLIRHRHAQYGERDEDTLVYELARRFTLVIQELKELKIPYPTNNSSVQFNVIELWEIYLSLLLPLAIKGNMRDARTIFAKMQSEPVEPFWLRILRKGLHI